MNQANFLLGYNQGKIAGYQFKPRELDVSNLAREYAEVNSKSYEIKFSHFPQSICFTCVAACRLNLQKIYSSCSPSKNKNNFQGQTLRHVLLTLSSLNCIIKIHCVFKRTITFCALRNFSPTTH